MSGGRIGANRKQEKKMKHGKHASACTVFRPDAAGNLVAVSVIKPEPQTAAPRSGAVFGAWDDQVQSWEHDDPVTLERAAQAAYHNPDLEVCFRAGDYCPKPLNAAERRELRAMMADAE